MFRLHLFLHTHAHTHYRQYCSKHFAKLFCKKMYSLTSSEYERQFLYVHAGDHIQNWVLSISIVALSFVWSKSPYEGKLESKWGRS